MEISHQDSFKIQILKMLRLIDSMLESCFNAKLTATNSKGLKVGISQIESDGDPDVLMKNFIKSHDHWKKIFEKDTSFICETLPELYKSDYLNTKVLAIPIQCYKSLQNKE